MEAPFLALRLDLEAGESLLLGIPGTIRMEQNIGIFSLHWCFGQELDKACFNIPTSVESKWKI